MVRAVNLKSLSQIAGEIRELAERPARLSRRNIPALLFLVTWGCSGSIRPSSIRRKRTLVGCYGKARGAEQRNRRTATMRARCPDHRAIDGATGPNSCRRLEDSGTLYLCRVGDVLITHAVWFRSYACKARERTHQRQHRAKPLIPAFLAISLRRFQLMRPLDSNLKMPDQRTPACTTLRPHCRAGDVGTWPIVRWSPSAHGMVAFRVGGAAIASPPQRQLGQLRQMPVGLAALALQRPRRNLQSAALR